MAEGSVPSGKKERALREHSSCSQVKGHTRPQTYANLRKGGDFARRVAIQEVVRIPQELRAPAPAGSFPSAAPSSGLSRERATAHRGSAETAEVPGRRGARVPSG